MRRRQFTLVLTLSVAWLSSAPVSASMIANESFETGPDPVAAMELPVGSTAVSGWQVTRNPIDYCGSRWAAMQGVRSVALNGTGPGGIAQTFATDITAVYTVTYYLSGDPLAMPFIKNMRVTAAGQSQDETFDVQHTWPWAMGWNQRTFSFTAVSTSTTLEFYSLDAGSTGPAVDKIDVVLTTPATVSLAWQGRFALGPATPSPSRGPFQIEYVIPFEAAARVSVWDLQGREVSVLAGGVHSAGRHASAWDGRIDGGRAPAGVYFIRLSAPGVSLARKAVLAR